MKNSSSFIRNCIDSSIISELKKLGCDFELDSNATSDRCGVCNGDTSTCTVIAGTTTVNDTSGILFSMLKSKLKWHYFSFKILRGNEPSPHNKYTQEREEHNHLQRQLR
jgi:hypothetical protein